MAAKTLVQHWLGFDDSERIRENIFSFVSSQKDEKLIGCDYLESLTMIVSHLLQNNENTTYNERGNVEHEQWINDVLNEILTQICIPTLRMPRPTAYDINKRDKMQIFELTCDLVSRIVCKGPIANEKYIWTLVLKSLKSYVDESRSGVDVGNKADEQLLEVATALDLLANLLGTINKWQDDRSKFVPKENSEKTMEETVLYNVLDVLEVVGNGSLLFKITGRILPQLLLINEKNFFRNTKIIWDSVKSLILEEQVKSQHSLSFFSSYAIMSSLADLYFNNSSKMAFNVHQDPVFWSMIQAGLVNIDSLVRKQSLYLLQRAVQMSKEQGLIENVYLEETCPVFWWHPDNAEEIIDIWQQYVFFLETFEEKQLHVIQPVLPRIIEIINATKKAKEFFMLHVSWLSVIVHRAAIHENRFVKKWGITTLLTLNLEQVPLLENDVTRRFTCDTLIMLLKEPTLYAKNHGEGKAEPSLLAKHLLAFFKECFHALDEEEKIGFFTEVFASISRYNISHVPLTYISQGLSNVPNFPKLCGELLSSLRSIISNLVSHSVTLRGAVKTFLLRTFINFINPSSVTMDEVLMFLGSFVKEGSLCRGTPLWNEVTVWLSANLENFQRETKNLFMCLENKVKSFLKDDHDGRTRETAVRLAKFLLLCHDCSAVTKNQMNQLFDTIFVTISKAQSNVYQPVSCSWQAVELLCGLCQELTPVGGEEPCIADDVTSTLMSCLPDVFLDLTQTLIRTISQGDECASFHGYSTYFAMLDKVKSLWLSKQFPANEFTKYQTLLNKLVDLGLSLWDGEEGTHCLSVKRCLHVLVILKLNIWVAEFTDATDFELTNERKNNFLKCIWSNTLVSSLRYPNEGKSQEASLLKEDSWRFVAEDIITTKWRCVNFALKESPSKVISCRSSPGTLGASSYSDIVEACVEALSLTAGPACYTCLETLRLCLPKLIEEDDEETTVLLLKTAWSVLNEIRSRYSGYFWPALDIVVRIIFAPELLSFTADGLLISYVRKYWESLLSLADDQSGLVSVAVVHLCKVFTDLYKSQSANVMSLNWHADIVADMCLFGPVHKKDLRLLLDTAAYVKTLGNECGVLDPTRSRECECESARVRVHLLAFLLRADGNDPTCSLLLLKLIRVLLERNQELSEIKASRFLNSENHRKKQRLWQVVLILVSRITDEHSAIEFSNILLQALESDNQTSVRFFIEWSLVRLLSGYTRLLDAIWQDMKNLYKVRLGYVASLISIVTHVFLTLEEPIAQMEYLHQLLPAIIPCAFLNHSQIRAYILTALQLICETCSEDVWSQIIHQFPVVQSCLMFAHSVVEGEKEKNRLQKDRDLFSLHPVKDFNIEMIFKTVPLIAGVVEEEVIAPDVFQSECSLSWVEVSDLPLFGRKLKQESGKVDESAELCVEESAHEKTPSISSGSVTSDVQKKITPWNVIAPPQDQDSFDYSRQRPIERRVGDLVVVASLIDRAPNLGGLCRTCEIFGASKLVLGSKHVVGEKDFKSVSVSSEKWVDVEEVKVHDLEMYLLKMKRDGFTIVGVEQTAQSKKLTKYQFARSTVLVLGNEKAGIPVEIIQLLDECVEIPQHGIIRSLNVHVSGALFVWEYSRQHLNDK